MPCFSSWLRLTSTRCRGLSRLQLASSLFDLSPLANSVSMFVLHGWLAYRAWWAARPWVLARQQCHAVPPYNAMPCRTRRPLTPQFLGHTVLVCIQYHTYTRASNIISRDMMWGYLFFVIRFYYRLGTRLSHGMLAKRCTMSWSHPRRRW